MRVCTEDQTAAPRTFVDILGGWADGEEAGKLAFTFKRPTGWTAPMRI